MDDVLTKLNALELYIFYWGLSTVIQNQAVVQGFSFVVPTKLAATTSIPGPWAVK
jgi:hypothetical protein